MSRPLLSLALLASAAIATHPADAAAPAAPGWTMSDVTPGVLVRHAGVLRPARRGMALAGGDVVMTGGNARAMLVRGEEYAIVAPGTQLVVAASAGASGTMQFIEKVGNTVFSVKKMLSPHFSVGTPYLAAVVKGTTFGVTVDDHGSSVQVLEGAVEVSNPAGASALIRPGTIGRAIADSLDLTLTGAEARTVAPPLTASGMRARVSNVFDRAALGSLRLVLPASAGAPEVVYARVQDDLGRTAPGLIFGGLVGLLVAATVATARAIRRRRAKKAVQARSDERVLGAPARRYGETGPSL